MQKLLIEGKRVLSGEINISGSKNATLPILAASILNKTTIIKNIPFVNDIFTMIELLKFMDLEVLVQQHHQNLKNINMVVV